MCETSADTSGEGEGVEHLVERTSHVVVDDVVEGANRDFLQVPAADDEVVLARRLEPRLVVVGVQQDTESVR